jgi:hypothetical protein
MKNKWYIFLSALIITLALFLRLYKIENRAPFDWDQNRDYKTIAGIASGKATLIGPVAKGEGGFFLGPLYYYLSTPAYIVMDGSPLALPVTSVIIDVLAVVAILVLLPRVWGRWQSLGLAFIWSLSWFAIEMSRISWNVSLIPLWSVVMIYLLSLDRPFTMLESLMLGITASLSWHIHAALIPLAPLLLLFSFKRIVSRPSTFFAVAIGYIIPLLPLALFDLRHNGLERDLIRQFVTGGAIVTPPWWMVFESVFSRFGKNIIVTLTGISALHLSVGIVAAVFALLAVLRGSKISKVAGLTVILNLALVIKLRELGFPEYYLASCYFPVIIIVFDFLFHFKQVGRFIALVLLVIFAVYNVRAFTLDANPFSLKRKMEVARAIAGLSSEVDLHFDLPMGRDSGIVPLLRLESVKISSGAPTQVVISESVAESMFIDGEIARDIGRFGGLRVAYRVVQ